jgi:hypothetical protein
VNSHDHSADVALPIRKKLAMPGTFRSALHGIRRLEISQILLEESNRSPERVDANSVRDTSGSVQTYIASA